MFSVILTWLGQLLGGPFATAAVDAYKAKLAAGNDANKIAADLATQSLEIAKQRDALAEQIVLAEQGNWLTRAIRPLLAMPIVIFVWKVVVWDTVLQEWTHGHTDALTTEMYWVMSTVITAYFVNASVKDAMTAWRKKA
jgi:hypothetical protein